MFPQPDEHGRFGAFGGRYVPETLMAALDELQEAWASLSGDPGFAEEYAYWLKEYVGRPSLLTPARNLSRELGGATVWLKREDLNHTGAHKINNALGQALIARRLGKKRIIAETGAGQHGVAAATAAALFGLDCVVYMGEEDVRRQELNVFRMQLLGAEVIPVRQGTRTLKDATSEAIRDWVTNVRSTYYLIGSVVGPHPYPAIVRDLQSVIGRETRAQLEEYGIGLPAAVIACVGGGSNAMGIFSAFAYEDAADRPRLIGVEAAGRGLDSGRHSASIANGKRGVLHGSLMYLLSDVDGQVLPAHSISAGLDYPGVGPEHAFLHDAGIAEYVQADDGEALDAFRRLTRTEGIIPALESAHAVAAAIRLAPQLGADEHVVVCLSGRGDKDVAEVRRLLAEGGAQ